VFAEATIRPRVCATLAPEPAAARQPRAWPGRTRLGPGGRPGYRPGCLRGRGGRPGGGTGRDPEGIAWLLRPCSGSAPPGPGLTRLSKPLINALFLVVSGRCRLRAPGQWRSA